MQTRVFALANRFRPAHNASSWDLSPVAQEPLNVIEYARLGDEYKCVTQNLHQIYMVNLI